MAKHRKTRREKIRSEQRSTQLVSSSPNQQEHTGTMTQQTATTYTFSSANASAIKTSHQLPSLTTSVSYAFVKKDLQKTIIVCGIILTAQVVLYSLMHIV